MNAIGTARIAMIATLRTVRSTIPECYLRVITMMPSTTAAPAARSATTPSRPNATAAAGRPSRFMSANLEAPRTAIEKIIVTPTPAMNDAAMVFSRAWVSTIVASMVLRCRNGSSRANSPGERGRRERDRRRGDDDRANRPGAEYPGHPVGERADSGRSRQRHQPGRDDVSRHAPTDRRDPLAGAGAHDAAADHLGGREREAEVRRGQDHRGSRTRGREPLGRVHANDAGAHGPDDPPAARVGAERDRAGCA